MQKLLLINLDIMLAAGLSTGKVGHMCVSHIKNWVTYLEANFDHREWQHSHTRKTSGSCPNCN